MRTQVVSGLSQVCVQPRAYTQPSRSPGVCRSFSKPPWTAYSLAFPFKLWDGALLVSAVIVLGSCDIHHGIDPSRREASGHGQGHARLKTSLLSWGLLGKPSQVDRSLFPGN